MTRIRRCPNSRHALILFVLLAAAGAVAPQAAPSLAYSVRLTDLKSAQLAVRLQIHGISTDKPLVLRSVPAYMANPLADPVANPLSAVRVTGLETGQALACHKAPHGDGMTYTIAKPERSLRLEYTVSVAFQDSAQTRDYPIKLPFMDARRSLLYGNYIFIFPDFGEELAAAVGRPLDVTVEFQYPNSFPLWGTPDRVQLHSLYQLMSLQFGFGDFERDSFEAGGVPVSIVYLKDEFDARERAAIRRGTETAFEAVIEFFGGAPFDQFSVLIYRASGTGGMEGTFSCQVYVNSNLNVADASSSAVRGFYAVILHEIFHSWNPIAIYPTDDPWIKEGITAYYGEALGARSGLLRDLDLRGNFGYYTKQLNSNSLFEAISLTDSRIWHNEYSSESWRTLTYERGKAVALLLDVSIRERTQNRKSLDDVLRMLYDRFRNRSYSHAELLQAVETVAGQDFSTFFRDYVSGFKAPSLDEIETARKQAFEFGILQNSAAENELAPH